MTIHNLGGIIALGVLLVAIVLGITNAMPWSLAGMFAALAAAILIGGIPRASS